MDDKKMIEALNRIAEAQERQTQEWAKVCQDLCEIKDSIQRIHLKLDETAKETTINTEKIKALKEQFVDEKRESSDKFDIVHGSIQRRDGHFRWLVAVVVVPIGLALIAIFKQN